MIKNSNISILYPGIDIDDKFFHVVGYEPSTKEKIEFKVKAAKTKLAKKLKKLRKGLHTAENGTRIYA